MVQKLYEKGNLEKITGEKHLYCKVCGKDLLEKPQNGMIKILRRMSDNVIVSVNPYCKGECDNDYPLDEGMIYAWQDVTDYMNPALWLKNLMNVINDVKKGDIDNPDVIDSYKKIFLATAPYVMRDVTEPEEAEYELLTGF